MKRVLNAPSSIRFIVALLSSFFYISFIKIIFSDFKVKNLFIIIGLITILYNTVFIGMIGTIVFWSISVIILYSPKVKPSIFLKSNIILGGLVIIIILQSVKAEYRELTWKIRTNTAGKEVRAQGNRNPGLFYNLILERVNNPSKILSASALSGIASRINQSLQVNLVMKRVPQYEPYAMGEMTLVRPFISLVPRIFWEKKPLLPDPNDYKRFTGIGLSKFNSVTIGPIGEAYADFGMYGILFLLSYGCFFRLLYSYFLRKSISNPNMIIWYLIIFVTGINNIETTVAGAFNSYLKIALLVVIIKRLIKI
jgi:hypothetical protein